MFQKQHQERVSGKEFIYEFKLLKDKRINNYLLKSEQLVIERRRLKDKLSSMVIDGYSPEVGRTENMSMSTQLAVLDYHKKEGNDDMPRHLLSEEEASELDNIYKDIKTIIDALNKIEENEPKKGEFQFVEHGIKESALANEDIPQQFLKWYAYTRVAPRNVIRGIEISEEEDIPASSYIGGQNQVAHKETLEFLDALSTALAITGLDIVVDAYTVGYSIAEGDYANALTYAAFMVTGGGEAFKVFMKGTKKLEKLGKKFKLARGWDNIVKQFTLSLGDVKKLSTQNLNKVGGIGDISGIAFKQGDNYVDVIIHSNNGKYDVWIDKVKHELNEQDLANLIKQKIPEADKDKAIRLLSCSNLESAEELSKVLDNRKIIATDSPVVLYLDENNNIVSIQSSSPWKEVRGQTRKDYNPNWNTTNKTGKYVRMGEALQIITNKFPDEALPSDGKLYSWEVRNGKVFQLTSGDATVTQKNFVDFIVDTEGNIRFGVKHHFLGNKQDVIAAGQLKIKKGKIYEINNLSGHYQPTPNEAMQYGSVLRGVGLDVDGAQLQLHDIITDSNQLVTDFKLVKVIRL